MGEGDSPAAVSGYPASSGPSVDKASGYAAAEPKTAPLTDAAQQALEADRAAGGDAAEAAAPENGSVERKPMRKVSSVTFAEDVVQKDGDAAADAPKAGASTADAGAGAGAVRKGVDAKGSWGTAGLPKRVARPRMRSYPCAVPLRGVVQHYAWGQHRETSLVAAMATEQVRSKRSPLRVTPLSRGTRFAELWMGTHPNGPSSVIVPGASMDNPHVMRPCFSTTGDLSDEEGEREELFLKDLIASDPQFWLGDDWQNYDIPYLFKVLSIQQALSIQAHPNKKLAEKLHKRLPSAYPDANHKPEICIPLGHFEALCGFRRTDQIRAFVRDVKELGDLCIGKEEDLESEGIRELYSRLMTSDPKIVTVKFSELISRLRAKADDDRTPEEELILRVSKDYPSDVGIFSIFFLNYVRITADQTQRFIYCAPDEPHAYLLGECVECMAMSDNVVRAGLTPKFKDVDTLLDMMTYRDDLLDELVGVAEQVSPNVSKYDPPVSDFLVYEISGPVEDGLHLPKASIAAQVVGSSCVTFATDEEEEPGAPQTLVKGYTFFTKAGTTLYVDQLEEGAKLFIATY